MNPGAPESENTRTILLVEDEEMTRSFIQRFLEREGYSVIAVDAAEEGIVEAAETTPDILISDIHLPGLSGVELASFLLAQDPGMPVILMTGDPDEDLARRAMACGPVQYLLKPFEWFEMQAAVQFALGQRQGIVDLETTAVLELTEEAFEAEPGGEAVVETDPEVQPRSVPEPVSADAAAPVLERDAVAAPGPEPSIPAADAWMDEVDRASWAGPGHGDRVAHLALALLDATADRDGIDASDLALAGRVHEAGRLHLANADPADVARYSADVLAEAGFPGAVVEAVRFMHERWDGGADADGLSGSRIPAASQLLAVADALDHYASAWILSGLEVGEAATRAMNLVTVQQNQAFGPGAVSAMHEAADSLRGICEQERASGATASSPVPALSVAESVPFALFATG